MLKHLENYAKKTEEKRYPPAPIPEAAVLIFLGDKVCENAQDMLQIFRRRWPDDMHKRLYICFLNRKDTEETEFSHYRFRSAQTGNIAESDEEIEGLNRFFREESLGLNTLGNSMKIVVFTCPEDIDSLLAADVIGILKSFCEINVTMNIKSYLNVLLPLTPNSKQEADRILVFFENAVRWKDRHYETEAIFCQYEDSEPETILASNNGLVEGILVFDSRDENNRDIVSDKQRALMIANTLEFNDLFDSKQKYLQIPGEQPTGVGYEFVLASALSKERWDVLPSPKLGQFNPDISMKNATRVLEDELWMLLRCAGFAVFDRQYQEQGKILTTGKSWETLEKEYFGNTINSLYQQWEEKLMGVPVPIVLEDTIDKLVSLEEIESLQNRFDSLEKYELIQNSDYRNYSIIDPVYSLESPWQLRDYIVSVYEHSAEISINRLYAKWAGKCKKLLDKKREFLKSQQALVDRFFASCDGAETSLKKTWKEWNYTGPEMKIPEESAKLKLREKIIECMEAGDSDFEEVIRMAEEYIIESYPKKGNLPEPVYYCRLDSPDLHGGLSTRHREVEKGIASGKKVAFYEPRAFSEIRLIKTMTVHNP